MKAWEVIKSEVALPTKWFKVIKQTVRWPSGKIVDDFYFWDRGDIAMTIPVTTDNKIIFVKQYRHGAGIITLELPSGFVDNGESHEDAAPRELLEETGYQGKSRYLGTLNSITTKIKGELQCYLVTECVQIKQKDPGESEENEVVLIAKSDLKRMIQKQDIIAVESIAALVLANLI